jgi:hypothetical protein
VHGRALRANGVASVDEYIDLLSTPQKDIAAQLRALIRTHFPRLGEDIKWYVPVYSLGTIPIVSIEEFKAHVNLKFFDVARLQDPEGILEGTGKGVRHVKFRSTQDVEEHADEVAQKAGESISPSTLSSTTTSRERRSPRYPSMISPGRSPRP